MKAHTSSNRKGIDTEGKSNSKSISTYILSGFPRLLLLMSKNTTNAITKTKTTPTTMPTIIPTCDSGGTET